MVPDNRRFEDHLPGPGPGQELELEPRLESDGTVCAHCGQPLSPDAPKADSPKADNSDGAGPFCCGGCAAAYDLIRGLGLGRYYQRRGIDPEARPLRPDDSAAVADFSAHTKIEADGTRRLHLMVDGIHCGACVWLIESALARQPGVDHARLNMTTRRLNLAWDPERTSGEAVVGVVTRLGYRAVPYDPDRLIGADRDEEKALLKALAVAGFAAANVMLLSVAVWAGYSQGMGPVTRDLMHWVSALICLPAIAYAIRPFAKSALGALRHGRANMDVPICVGVILATGMSLFETINGGPHAYFDGATMLLFFLLIGRYLDRQARGRARSAAEQLLGLAAVSVTVLDSDGHARASRPDQVRLDDVVLVATGERVPVDGTVIDGVSDLDTALISGETVPVTVRPGDRVFAGVVNLTAPLRLRATAVGEGTFLAEIVRLMEVAEQGRARYVAIADRVSRLYAPVVHAAAFLTFLGWLWLGDLPWQAALMNAVAVLIITCPCALGLAVPVVQVIASGRLLRRGILLKSATALERLALVDTVVFDKTGTLTEGTPRPILDDIAEEDARVAASLATLSRHPLARALALAVPGVAAADDAREIPGSGMVQTTPEGEIRLGNRAFVGVSDDMSAADGASGGVVGPEMWLARPGRPPVRFPFIDTPRPDAEVVVARLLRDGKRLALLSGDRRPVVAALAARLGMADWRAERSPADKVAALEEMRAAGRQVLMVGDGLNDAPALASALVSMSPSTAADVSQTAADVVFQGRDLAPIIEALEVARRADRLVRQNFALAFLYNALAIPLAVAGMLTPLLAALAMSSSSLIVILNALRLTLRGRQSR